MKKPMDLTLYLVLDPTLCAGIDGMVKTALTAVEYGATVVQLRAEYEFSRKEWFIAATQLKQALAPTKVPLIINDQVDIALAVDADGVHVGQNDLPVDIVRRLIGPDKLLGLSVSTQQQMDAVPWSVVDYLGVGPVFPTTSKRNAPTALGVTQFSQIIKQRRVPVVAIGGINAKNAETVMQTGVEGVAVVSSICGQPDIKQATLQLIEQIRQGKR